MKADSTEAYVVGSGPNGLTAGITLARAGFRVTVLEAQPSIGGGARSAQLTLPGFVHDLGSAVHPFTVASPAFRSFPLHHHGLEWIHPPFPLAHPLEHTAVILERSVRATAQRLGPDALTYRLATRRNVDCWNELISDLLGPLKFPKHPLLLARFGVLAPWPANFVAKTLFRTTEARALFAGLAAHSLLPFEWPISAAFGWMLGLAGHAVGWPIPRGGAQSIANALASYLESLGGRIVPNHKVRSLDELKPAKLILLDITPRQLLAIAGDHLPKRYARKLQRYKYDVGVFKVDWALRAPIPWRSSECGKAGTVHLGGTLEEIAESEREPWERVVSKRPYVLLSQPSLFDPTRAPAGQHTAWAYCHVPAGSNVDMLPMIEDQIERFAPGFREVVLARSAHSPADLEHLNANLIGGNITGGAQNLGQFFTRPTTSLYRTPLKGVYLCSSSTPPGGAVHGMCGYSAAQWAIGDWKRGALA